MRRFRLEVCVVFCRSVYVYRRYGVQSGLTLRQTLLTGPDCNLCPRGEAQLGEDILHVFGDRSLADDQGLSQDTVRAALDDQRRDLALARRQPIKGLLGRPARRGRRDLLELRADAAHKAVMQRLVGKSGSQRGNERLDLGARLLRRITAGLRLGE